MPSCWFVRAWLPGFVLAVLVFAAAPGAVRAQATGTIRGTVVEVATGHPVADAQVAVEGTRLGAVTSSGGEFAIAHVPYGTVTVRVRRIGYASATQTAAVGAGVTPVLRVTLRPAAISLDQVVVTGTAGATQERRIGNAVSTLNAAQLTRESSVPNVTSLLQGKVPGVVVAPGSGAPGTAADIQIRGISSLSASNRPIFYVDGVRYSDAPVGNYGPSGTGFAGNTFSQGASVLDFINPEDIQSIEVIKGPAAATLYGADAAGGVIQIITKKGARGEKPSWTFKGETGSNQWGLPTPLTYTTCTAARIADAKTWPGCSGVSAGTVLTDDPLRRDPHALRNGYYGNFAGSVRGGGDRYSYFLSGDRVVDQGVLHNSSDARSSGRGNFGYTLSRQLDVQLNTTYIVDNLQLPLSDDAAGGILISAVRGLPGHAANQAPGFAINSPATANQYDNVTRSERTILGGTANYRPWSWFRNRFTVGMDANNALAVVDYPPGTNFSAGTYPGGLLANANPVRHLYTFDYAGTISTALPHDLTSEFSVGAQGNKSVFRRTEAVGTGLPSAAFQLVGSANQVTGSTSFSEQASLGYFVQEQIGYANRLFVTGAVRADDNSAFGVKFKKVYYPKASLSYVVSEEPRLAGLFRRIGADNVRLRFAYGQAGRAPGPYDALQTYTATKAAIGTAGTQSGLIPSAPGNPDLHAERGIETESGFDASFLGGRIGAQFTYYDKTTADALLSVANAPSLGFTNSRYVNFGRIHNAGTELGLTLRPIQRPAFAWDAQVNYATNHNALTRLAYQGITSLTVYDPYLPVTAQRLIEGYPIAGWWGIDAQRDASGKFLLDASGHLQLTPLHYIGPSTPTREGSVSNTFTLFRNFRVYALVDFKGGYYVLNQKERGRAQNQLNDALMNRGTLSPIDSAYYRNTSITAPWIQPGDFAKWRDVSVSYTLPARLAGLFRSSGATLTVAGHNLGYVYKRYGGLDPEVNFIGQGTFLTGTTSFIQFLRVDSYTLPMLRRWTAALTLNF